MDEPKKRTCDEHEKQLEEYKKRQRMSYQMLYPKDESKGKVNHNQENLEKKEQHCCCQQLQHYKKQCQEYEQKLQDCIKQLQEYEETMQDFEKQLQEHEQKHQVDKKQLRENELKLQMDHQELQEYGQQLKDYWNNDRQKSLEIVANELNCHICNEIFDGPVTTACGHVFCKVCLDMWVKKCGGIRKSTCPDCRAKIKSMSKNRYIENLVQKLSSALNDSQQDSQFPKPPSNTLTAANFFRSSSDAPNDASPIS